MASPLQPRWKVLADATPTNLKRKQKGPASETAADDVDDDDVVDKTVQPPLLSSPAGEPPRKMAKLPEAEERKESEPESHLTEAAAVTAVAPEDSVMPPQSSQSQQQQRQQQMELFVGLSGTKCLTTWRGAYATSPLGSDPRHISTGVPGVLFPQPFNNFLKGVKWSPDGLCLLTNSEDNVLRLFEVPSYDTLRETPTLDHAPVLQAVEGETVYDFAWNPTMSSADPASCFFVSSCRDHPLHLWDAFTGKLKASYTGFDDADEVTAALSVCFSLDGQYMYSGYDSVVRVFNVSQPGRPIETSGTTALYAEDTGELICSLEDGHPHGVTHTRFSPDGRFLFTGGRKDDHILCWDVRNTNGVLAMFERPVSTNQRVAFDVDPYGGRFLMSGTHLGTIKVWDLQEPPDAETYIISPLRELKPSHSSSPGTDGIANCVNGVAFHPYFCSAYPVFASTSGERVFDAPEQSDDDDADGGAASTAVGDSTVPLNDAAVSSSDSADSESGALPMLDSVTTARLQSAARRLQKKCDNGVSVWEWFGDKKPVTTMTEAEADHQQQPQEEEQQPQEEEEPQEDERPQEEEQDTADAIATDDTDAHEEVPL